ncbi:MAG: DUF4364 family protein [Gemmiger sp.]|uniref:DUF4364 family protein n=1 Tax=Gemmiger sp. TaxID=2049027 RepID=UPI002E782A95|nr:DUF4364 family protein [Gemmiger sp.]MEE0801848.1 DUF4364 family protein [Gemmiger sp.]
MAEAFTGGVKRGGLTSDVEIRILLCYLIKTVGPVTQEAMQGAVLQEELVNYFEFANALVDLESQELAELSEDGYRITRKGAVVADTLSEDLPRSVRESAILAVIRIQSWVHKAAQNHATIQKVGDHFRVTCTIQDDGHADDAFRLELTMPDALTAEQVKNRFISRGSEIYARLLTTLTQPLTDEERPPEGAM